MKNSVRKSRKKTHKRGRGRSLRGGAVFTTEEKDNLRKDGGFTQDQLDYLASLPENFRSSFGSVQNSDYDFIKSWQMSVSDLYDIPPTPENMKQLAEKTIEDFKYFFERRTQQQEQPQAETDDTGSVWDEMDANISSVSLGGKRKRRYTRRRSNKRR
jgi:hypothetical protein